MEFSDGLSGSDAPFAGETTGRFLALFEEGAAEDGAEALADATGVSVTTATTAEADVEREGILVFEQLDVAVVDAPPEGIQEATVAAEGRRSPIVAVEPERVVHAIGATAWGTQARRTAGAPLAGGRSAEYLAGYRDAVLHLTDTGAGSAVIARPPAAAVDETQATWGLQAVKAVNSALSGTGVKLAVLDTGLDLNHPDFEGRNITSESFIRNEEVQDGNGHGTHCIGTSMGSKAPPVGPRYGVAHGADIFVGKVLSNRGSGTDRSILSGIQWAIANGCDVISMSLGAATRVGQRYSLVFEFVARRAQRAGTLIIAAAGNESDRPNFVAPVGHPANCPSIMAVAAIDVNMAIAPFSCAGINPNGGQVDVAGPGVDIYSSWPMPTRYRRISGTSMATPHAAGIAALLAEENPEARGAALAQQLVARAQRLDHLSSADVGAGLVQAP